LKKETSVNLKEKGAAVVEFALVAVIFFTVLFSIIEFGYLYWVTLTMQHAVREGARYAVVTDPSYFPGPTPLDPSTQAQKRCKAVKASIKDNAMGLYERVVVDEATDVTFYTVDSATGNTVNLGSSCGDANQIIMIDLKCTLPLITPLIQPFFTGGIYMFHVGATMKNEAFE
jgi:hypothetical protein